MVVTDGARWIWKNIEKEFNFDHCKALDWFHTVEHFSDFANSHFGRKRSEEKSRRIEASKQRLMNDQVGRVISGLKQMKPREDQSQKAISSPITYLKNNSSGMNYGTLKKEGLSIGSGGMLTQFFA